MKLILLGKILKPHALKGMMSCYLENTEDSSLKPGKKIVINSQTYEVESINFHNSKKTMIKLKNVDHINDLGAILNQDIYIDREEIDCEDGEIILNDLINLDVVSNGLVQGRVDNFYSNGAQDILVVKGKTPIEIPLIDQFIKSIDLNKNTIEVILPEYL